MAEAKESSAGKARKKGPKTIAREYFAAIASMDLDAAQALWKPGGIDNLHGLAELRAPEGFREYFEQLFAAFPDWRFEVVEICASGSNASVRWRAEATFSGPGRFQGLAPTGRAISIEGCDMLRVEDGLIVENNAYVNGAQLAEQLGVLPPQGSAGERAMTAAFNAKTASAKGAKRLIERIRS